MPVEELILLGQAANLLFVPGIDDVERGVVYSWGRAGIAADIWYAFGTP